MNPRYAKFVPVQVPVEQDPNVEATSLVIKTKSTHSRNLGECYDGVETQAIEMEERNIYCGAYNVLVLQDV
jgi:F-box/WD-40 domain protein 10